MKKITQIQIYVLLVAICRSQLIYKNFYDNFSPSDYDWSIYSTHNHGFQVVVCQTKNLVLIYDCVINFNNLMSKTFELPQHSSIKLSFTLWIFGRYNDEIIYLYIDNQIQRIVQTSQYSLINTCSSIGQYYMLEIVEYIKHYSTSVLIQIISNDGFWGISEIQLFLINNSDSAWEITYQSLNKKNFSYLENSEGWSTNNIISMVIDSCEDFNYLKSTGNNFAKDFILESHKKISIKLKVLVFKYNPASLQIKIDRNSVANYISNQYVYSDLDFYYQFITISVNIEEFIHFSSSLRIELITQVSGTSSWFGIRDFQLFIQRDQIQQFRDFCFQKINYYIEGCSNYVQEICIQCQDGWNYIQLNLCIPICGDQQIISNEECDDGNQIPYDGCHLCKYSCSLNCSLCIFGICQVCEQNYILILNACVSTFYEILTYSNQLQIGYITSLDNYIEDANYYVNNDPDIYLTNKQVCSQNCFICIFEICQVYEQNYLLILNVCVSTSYEIETYSNQIQIGYISSLDYYRENSNYYVNNDPDIYLTNKQVCSLNCIICIFEICQVCEQNYLLILNVCVSTSYEIETYSNQIQIGYISSLDNYIEDANYYVNNDPDIYLTNKQVCSLNCFICIFEICQVYEQNYLLILNVCVSTSYEIETYSNQIQIGYISSLDYYRENSNYYVNNDPDIYLTNKQVCSLNCIICIFEICQVCEQNYLLILNVCVSISYEIETYSNQIQIGYISSLDYYRENSNYYVNNDPDIYLTNKQVCSLNCIICIFEICQVCEQNYLLILNVCVSISYEIETYSNQIQIGYISSLDYYIEDANYYVNNDPDIYFTNMQICSLNCIFCFFGICKVCEQNYFLVQNECYFDQLNLIKNFDQLESYLSSQTFKIFENDYINYCLSSSFIDYDYLKIQNQQCFQANNAECIKITFPFDDQFLSNFKLSMNQQYYISNCNDGNSIEYDQCYDQNNIQFDGCYKCKQSCQIECQLCIQELCYYCVEGWQLVDNKCVQKCGDQQVALFSIEQCDDDENHKCQDCKYQCAFFCLFCTTEDLCIFCQENFELVNNVCQPICGDMIVVTGFEECDDGNEIQYDGCYNCQFSTQLNETNIIQQDTCENEELIIDGQCVSITSSLDRCLYRKNDLCLECKESYVLLDNMCLLCGNGLISDEEACDDGNNINNDGCSSLCEIEHNWNCTITRQNQSQCFTITQIQLIKLNTTLNIQYTQLTYSKKVQLDQQDLYFLDYNQNNIIDVDPAYYIIKIITLNEITADQSRNIKYLLIIEFKQQLIQDLVLNVTISLFLKDENNLSVFPASAQVIFKPPIVLSKSQIETSNRFQNFGQFLFIALICAAIFIILFDNPFELLTILDALQYQSYMKYINVEYPQNILIYFISSDIISLDLILKNLRIQTHFQDLLGTNMMESFGKFNYYQINADLITQLQCQLIQFALFFSSLLLMKIYLKIFSENRFWKNFISMITQSRFHFLERPVIKLYSFHSLVRRIQNYNVQNTIMNFYHTNFFDLSFKILLYLFSKKSSGIRNLISYAICIGYLILSIFIVARNFRKFDHKVKIEKFKLEQHQQIVLLKQFIFAFVLIWMQDCPLAQCVMLSFSACIHLAFIFSIQLTNSFLESINLICIEFPLVLFTLINISFCKDIIDKFTQNQIIQLGFLQVGLLIFAILGPILKCFYKIFNKIRIYLNNIQSNKIPKTLNLQNIFTIAKN